MLYLETCGNDGSAFATLWFPRVVDFGHGATGYTLQSASACRCAKLCGEDVNNDVEVLSDPWFRLLIVGGLMNQFSLLGR